MATAKKTTDHDVIQKWVEERGGHPAQVQGTGGMLRIDFGEKEENLEPISWAEFFKKFDENGIAFLYDPDKKSFFNKFVEDGAEGGR